MEINKTYDPSQIEKKWYRFWSEKGYFTPKVDKTRKPFTILIPPPNVTGILHMGHVLNNTLQDVIVRYHRMCGEPTLWLPGVDHAGIATQNVVEKQLATQGKTRHQIGREELVSLIWKWKEEKGDRIIEQLKQLGCSCDWTRQRFTMDEMLSKAVKEVFISLYNDGLIYKGKYIINWCPRCVTALANDEVEHADENGKLWYFRYPICDPTRTGARPVPTTEAEYVIIATTRPETMLGDTAVAVNPKDERYQHLIGKELILPLTDRTIPVIADDYVDMEFGTGCVKVTPAHDPNDFEIGNRHNLERLLIMDEHGIINDNAPEQFRGMDRYECRKKIIELITEQGLLEKICDHDLSVGHCYRCDTVIEPYLSDQWFVKMKPLAEEAIKVVESGEVKFQPERWTKVYMHWMNNIRDWCISRQIWWGHRIPAYYCVNCGKMVVAKEMPAICPECECNSFKQDEDVLDTWFSSWLWPFSTMGWPDETEDQQYFLPTNILITAPEIIYLWVARMIMSTLHFKKMIPFDTVLLHGTVRDEIGRKLSKSLGNSPDPIDIIETVGADALRFSIIFSTPKGADVIYSDAILETGNSFAIKIWNAYRLIMMLSEGNVIKFENRPQSSKWNELDWIEAKMEELIKNTRINYSNLDFNEAAQSLMSFFRDDFCDYYLEFVKLRLNKSKGISSDIDDGYVVCTTLTIMEKFLRLLHPIMPFITEEIWQNLKTMLNLNESSIIISEFPHYNESLFVESKLADAPILFDNMRVVRNHKKQHNLPFSDKIPIYYQVGSTNAIELMRNMEPYLNYVTGSILQNVDIYIDPPDNSVASVTASGSVVYIPLGDNNNKDKEIDKLLKQFNVYNIALQSSLFKLNNHEFRNKAKNEVIKKEEAKYLKLLEDINKILQALSHLGYTVSNNVLFLDSK